jgi:type I restriction enzyme S subunit
MVGETALSGRYEGYPEYKDSGVEWLGDVPISWNVLPIKRLSKIFNGSTPKSGEQLYWEGDIPWVTPADLGKTSSPYIERGLRNITIEGYDSCGTSLVPTNTVLLSSRAPIGTLGIAAKSLCTNQGCKSIVVNKANSHKFIYYVLLSSTKQLNLLGRGTTFLELSSEELGSYKVACPSEVAQQKIANFLDHETAKIDTLIDKQQQLIALLKEKRQAVISHAVTKGLNPNAPMRDSGVEWLGEVPSHWDVSKVKWVVDMAGRIGYRGYTVDDIVDEDEGAIVLSPSNINERGFNLDKKVFLSWNKYFESPEIKLEPGDVMLVKTSWSFGKVAVVTEVSSPMTINPQMVLLKKSKIDPRFVSYFLNIGALQARIFMSNTGSYMPTMTQENIGELTMFIPPMQEATDIADFIQKQQFKFNTLMDKQERVIELLLERRKALISAAVTGKIDVRNWAAPATTNKNKEVAA